MPFKIAHGNPQIIWAPITDSDTLYVGQLVKFYGNEGLQPLGAPSGGADTTNKSVVYGIVIGTNRYVPSHDTTYNTEKVTDATPSGNTVELVNVEGVWSKHDKVFMVQVAVIDPSTVIRGDLRNGSISTNLSARTVAASKGHNAQCTLDSGCGIARLYKPNDADVGVTATFSGTVYFRSGNAMGNYRLLDLASSIHMKWDKPLAKAASHDDTVVVAPGLPPVGWGHMLTDSESMYVDVSSDNSTNNWIVMVHKLDLREAGNEHVDFRFATCHFDPMRT